MSNPHLVLKNRLVEYRTKAGLSQTELAKVLNVSRDTISKIETGKFSPSAYLAKIMMVYFECSFDDLFYLEVEEKK